jgi:hypothetical protein
LIADACVAMSLHRRVRFTIHQLIPILILIPLSNPPGVCVFRQSGDRPNTPPRRNGMEHTPITASAAAVECSVTLGVSTAGPGAEKTTRPSPYMQIFRADISNNIN